PPEGRLSLEELGRVIAGQGVTTLWLTAGLFHQMVEEHPEGLRSVRQLLAGGDVLSPPHVRRLLTERPGLTLINGYGPTENTTFTCCHPIPASERVESPLPIGRPITGTRAVLLDRWFAPVPIGVAGELYASGHGLARGYAGRPDLTAERFVPHPYPGEPGERLYRTGDLARFRPDGTIEFLGRRDHQVKIRGFRIELGEIELALARQPGVREAAVLVREDAPGDKRLVAYVAAPPEAALNAQAALRAELPDYMVPAAFVRVDAFPLGPTGKVDRRALARIEPASNLRPEETSAAPRDQVEELLAGFWAEVLRVERVGREDDFFVSGGHSLLATQVVSRVREAFSIELPLQLLFELPTVAGLATAIRERLREGGSLVAPPILPVSRYRTLPLSFAQQRLWFLDRFEPGGAAYNIPAAVGLDGRLAPAVLERAVREVERRHEALRTTFAESGGQPVQVVSPEPRLDLPLVDLRRLPGAQGELEARRLAASEALRPFDLEAGPLVRAKLLRLGETEHVALVTFHHIVADGWSMGLFLEELAALYGAFSRAEPSPLPELPIQYADFALWQRSWLAGEVLSSELGYWRRQLAGAPRSLELPTDRPRPAAQTFRGRSLPVSLSPELTGAVARLGSRAGVTPFMTLLAAFQALMGRLARTEDVVVGTPIAGRNRRETESLIGFFVNTLVLRTDLGGDPTASELLGRVRQTALSGYAHQDVPFERLVEELQPERDLSFHPLFQVVFVLQNAPRGSFELPGLTLTPLAAEGETAKFDLTLSLQETAAGLQGSLEHNTDLFDGATLERWLGSFRVLLEGMIEAPGHRLSKLPWLAEVERRQVVVDWNATGSTGPADLCLHELFEAQVERTPGALAVVRHGKGLTYRELDRRAGGIARRLRELGVVPEERIGVCLERSLDLVAALLGVLKAGGAYVPLDPAYPVERLAFMVEDAGARLVLTQRSLLDRLPAAAEPIFLE
ncbi:MAG TPA: condensation domain-containing protein, partial [Thermoanaerobaculia bacterium]|nr:condensation domain-containing protein [Thermoanaerobaculia bacterium]